MVAIGVDAMPERATTERREHKSPCHQPRAIQKPIATFDGNLQAIAVLVAQRVFVIRRDEGVGSYLMASPDGQVFVLSECSLGTQRMLRERPGWLVGCYAATPRPRGPDGKRACPEFPTAPRVHDDLHQHFLDLGLVAADAIGVLAHAE